jgi:hypothetical protein
VEGKRGELTGRRNIKGIQQKGEHFTASDDESKYKRLYGVKKETLHNLYSSPTLVAMTQFSVQSALHEA